MWGAAPCRGSAPTTTNLFLERKGLSKEHIFLNKRSFFRKKVCKGLPERLSKGLIFFLQKRKSVKKIFTQELFYWKFYVKEREDKRLESDGFALSKLKEESKQNEKAFCEHRNGRTCRSRENDVS